MVGCGMKYGVTECALCEWVWSSVARCNISCDVV